MNHRALIGALTMLLCLSACATRPGRSDIKPATLLARSITLNGEPHRFAIWVPVSYDPRTPTPCVVFLHGAGECGTDGLKQTTVGLPPAAKADPQQWPCII